MAPLFAMLDAVAGLDNSSSSSASVSAAASAVASATADQNGDVNATADDATNANADGATPNSEDDDDDDDEEEAALLADATSRPVIDLPRLRIDPARISAHGKSSGGDMAVQASRVCCFPHACPVGDIAISVGSRFKNV